MAFFDNNPNDDDYDGFPGNDENSVEFAQKFDRDGYGEYTNLPEIDDRLEVADFERRIADRARRQRANDLRDAATRVQYWPHAGRFVIPKQNSYNAHLALVREGNQVDIQFDPQTYQYFDQIIALHARRPELFSPNHPDYPKYQTLRENIAVLRNDIMGIYMDDGSFDPGDEKYLPRLAQIASVIGDALNADTPAKKPFFPSLDTEVANVQGEGAAYIYNHILKEQTSSTWLGNIWAAIKRILEQPGQQWELPPIEMTAFSAKGLSMMPPEDEMTKMTAHELRQRCVEQAEALASAIDPTDTHAVRDVRTPERREAVRHGKIIIDWLKNIQFTDVSLEDFVSSGRPGEPNPERDAMAMMVDAYYSVMDTAIRSNPKLLDDPEIQAANEALDTVEHSIELLAKLEKPRSQEDAMDIGADITQQPEKWHELSKESVKRLMDRLRTALEKAMAEIELEQSEVDIASEAYAQNQIEEALAMQHAYTAKRTKKQKGTTQQQRIDIALRADDRAAGQGAYADDDDDAIRIGRQKLQTDAAMQQARTKLNSDGGTKAGKSKGGVDESMESQIALDAAMGKQMGGKNIGGKMPVNDELVKQLGRNIMAMQQQANIAASEIADFKGGGIGANLGTGESFVDKQDPKTNLNKNKPRIG